MFTDSEVTRLSALTNEFTEHEIMDIMDNIYKTGVQDIFTVDLHILCILTEGILDFEDKRYRLLKFVFSNIRLKLDISRMGNSVNETIQNLNSLVWSLFTDCDRLSLIAYDNPYLVDELYQLKFTVLKTKTVSDEILRLNFKILDISLFNSVCSISKPIRDKIRFINPLMAPCPKLPNLIQTNSPESQFNLYLFTNEIGFRMGSIFYEQYPYGRYDFTVSLLEEVIGMIDNHIVHVKRAI